MSKTKVLWFSRHDMTEDQLEDLNRICGDTEIVKIDGTMPNIHVPFQAEINNSGEKEEVKPMKELVNDFDVLAVVMPTHLKEQMLKISGGRPIMEAQNDRFIIKLEDGTEEKKFVFNGWYKIKEIKIVRERL